MIDENKLITEINEEFCADCSEFVCIPHCSVCLIKKLIRKQPKVGEWIPCSERLPEEYIENLCCDIHGNFIVGFPTTNAVSNTGYAVETDNEIMYDCVAWMPLPEPYKEDV